MEKTGGRYVNGTVGAVMVTIATRFTAMPTGRNSGDLLAVFTGEYLLRIHG